MRGVLVARWESRSTVKVGHEIRPVVVVDLIRSNRDGRAAYQAEVTRADLSGRVGLTGIGRWGDPADPIRIVVGRLSEFSGGGLQMRETYRRWI